MNVTVLGAGNMGAAFIHRFQAAGVDVQLVSRNQEKAAVLAAQYSRVSIAAADTAAQHSDIIVLATGYSDAVPALQSLGDLSGKVIVDITNPLTPDYMGLTMGHTSSAAEEIAKAFPGTHIVKAFNTIFATVLNDGGIAGSASKVPTFVASDNAAAKQAVMQLATRLGFEAVDAGSLKNARYLEPLAGLNIYFGYGAGMGTHIAPTWMRQA